MLVLSLINSLIVLTFQEPTDLYLSTSSELVCDAERNPWCDLKVPFSFDLASIIVSQKARARKKNRVGRDKIGKNSIKQIHNPYYKHLGAPVKMLPCDLEVRDLSHVAKCKREDAICVEERIGSDRSTTGVLVGRWNQANPEWNQQKVCWQIFGLLGPGTLVYTKMQLLACNCLPGASERKRGGGREKNTPAERVPRLEAPAEDKSPRD
ncbi:hypothetical protein KSP40_PGU005097 [Platanthera guangdongensis]|uniref:Uncharacterized protein n=1 Tax=Platanthera guangdongensis TaxID=2320717 RepID=A0ABR2LC70_9ASPA